MLLRPARHCGCESLHPPVRKILPSPILPVRAAPTMGLYCLLHHRVGQHNLQLGLGNKVYAILATAVDLVWPFLRPWAADFNHRHTFDANFLQRRLFTASSLEF